MNVYLAKFMMYYKIQQMHRDACSISQIIHYLIVNRRAVKIYLAMSEQEYENLLIQQSERIKELIPYESFIKERLEQTLQTTEPALTNKALDYVIDNKITSALDFKAIVTRYRQEDTTEVCQTKIIRLNPLNGTLADGALVQPDKSQIEDYQSIFNNNNHS